MSELRDDWNTNGRDKQKVAVKKEWNIWRMDRGKGKNKENKEKGRDDEVSKERV
jgi:hypothetical protein